jgi:hypothetical protein
VSVKSASKNKNTTTTTTTTTTIIIAAWNYKPLQYYNKFLV